MEKSKQKALYFHKQTKTPANNAIFISICNKLGHNIRYSIPQELAAENAYRLEEILSGRY